MSPPRTRLARLALAPLAVAAVAAAGCTVNVVMPEVPANHPASPRAESAPLPPPSPLLDSYRPIAPPPALAPMSHEGMDHGATEGMDHGTMDHDAMDHDAMDHESMGHGAPAPSPMPEPAAEEAAAPPADHHHGEEEPAPEPPASPGEAP